MIPKMIATANIPPRRNITRPRRSARANWSVSSVIAGEAAARAGLRLSWTASWTGAAAAQAAAVTARGGAAGVAHLELAGVNSEVGDTEDAGWAAIPESMGCSS
jgi:hypothetical protein